MLRPGDCGPEVFIAEELDGGGDNILLSLVVIVMAQ
jgi:hypothetical protein